MMKISWKQALRSKAMTIRSVSRTGNKGIYTVVLAIIMPLLVGFLGLGVDMAHYWWVRGQLQTAADAAALAGAKELNTTATRRATAPNIASTYAYEHTVNGKLVSGDDLSGNETGRWNFTEKTFSADGISDASANAVRVTLARKDVPNFFARALHGALASQTIVASAVAVSGGAGATNCGFPVVLASCGLQHTAGGQLVCPTDLTFQNGIDSVGFAHPDGSGPVNGHSVIPYIKNALQGPSCKQAVKVGHELQLQNGNDLAKVSIDDINTATKDGTNPVPIVIPVVDLPCEGKGPNYNRSAEVVGFIQMRLVGARDTGAAPAAVAKACPTLGKKNLCVVADCTTLANAPGGGTVQVIGGRVFLVD